MMGRRTVVVAIILLAGCSSPPAGPTWYGHVAALKTPAGEAAVASIRERLKDAPGYRVRHADAVDARAAAVRLVSVNGVKGLILGPGVTDAEAVAEAVRPYDVPVIVLGEKTTAGEALGELIAGTAKGGE